MSSPVPTPPDRDDLTPRQRVVLGTVVEEYIRRGTPVGSKHIAGREGIDYASSTIRYELARLEDKGYLDHPHTSAGRVPTDSGYRYYVDEIATEPPTGALSEPISAALALGEMRREVDAALRRLADVVSQVTNLLGVVTAPAPGTASIRHVEVLLLQPQLVMVVVITSTGEVVKRVLAFDAPVDHGLAEWGRDFLNERLGGMSLGARMVEARLDDPTLGPLERAFVGAVGPVLSDLEEEGSVLYVGGQSRFLADATSLEAVEALMVSLEERYRLLAVLRAALTRNDLFLRIGSEIPEPELTHFALVAAPYGSARRNLGTVSVIGPRRMDYRLAVATVREAAHVLSGYVEELYEGQ
jgi:heat-inducible transcriptional repressor